MTARTEHWVASPPPPEVVRAIERLASTPDVKHVAVMPDVHLAREVCVGVVTATSTTIFPEAVGGDIGCGIAAIELDCAADRLADARTAAKILDGLYALVPQNKHAGSRAKRLWPEDLDPHRLSNEQLRKLARREGRIQFATLGRGNHFLELQRDDQGGLWAMVHSGSRAMGPAIRDLHLRTARTYGALRGFDADSCQGRAYLDDLTWALQYAAASRDAMIDAICAISGEVLGAAPRPATRMSCHHNFVRRERNGGEMLWVHRKGAIPAGEGEAGIIAGSMGTPSYHVTGRGHGPALRSSSHGAGRVMSRTEARQRITMRDLERQLSGVWFDHRLGARLRDEAPTAYKDIDKVMKAQRSLTRIVRRLWPVLSYKGC